MKNPKSKKLIEEAGLKMQEFILKNLPSDIRRYCIKSKIDLVGEVKDNSGKDNTIKFTILNFNQDKMINNLIDSKCKNCNDLMKVEFGDDYDFENPDDGVSIYDKNNKLNYDKYEDFLLHCKEEIKKINLAIKKANTIYSTNCNIEFYDYDGEIDPDSICSPYISFKFNIPQFSISSFTDKELNQIEKVCNIKLDK